MRKNILFVLCAVLMCAAAAAQEKSDRNFFNHLSVGISGGTTGIGIDAAMPINNHFQLRAGVDIMPDITVNTDLDLNVDYAHLSDYYIPDNIDVEGKIGFTNGKILLDIYPFKRSSFHFTAGAYFGSSKIIKAYNEEYGLLKDVADYNKAVEAGTLPAGYDYEKIGVELGDYLLEPDEKGNVEASIKTASFKPYLGIGFGRAVPKKKRVGFMFELGVQFWGSPEVYCQDKKLEEQDLDSDGGDVIKTLSKITVYPVMSFRLCGRIL